MSKDKSNSSKPDSKSQEYVERSERAAAEILTWPKWMQRNLNPPTIKVENGENIKRDTS